MAGIKKRKRFFGAMSGAAVQQTAFGTPLADNDLDLRIKAAITFDEVNPTDPIYDCDESDQVGETETGKLMRITITYAQLTAKILAAWVAYFLGLAAVDGASQTNEVQTITGLVDGDTISFNFDGKNATSKPVTAGMSAGAFQSLLEAMDSIKAGNVTVTGTIGAGFVVTFVGRFAKTNVALMTVTGSGSAAQTTAGSNKTHSLNRTVDDVLPYFSLVTGFKADSSTIEKFFNCVVTTLALTLNRRKDVGLTVTILGRFTPEELSAFTVPECIIPFPLHGSDVRIKLNNGYITDLLNAGTVTLDHVVPTDDDAFPFDDIEIGNLELGEKPTYTATLDLLGSKGDANHTLAKTKAEVPLEILIGKPSDRVNLIFPNAHLALASGRIGYTASGRSFYPVVVTAYKDAGIDAPLRAEAYLSDQTTAFLTT